ncbi:MAG TPA: hypothetical protein VGB54_09010 [Allosphingosinicella sp.]|jgi:hypothetical protein
MSRAAPALLLLATLAGCATGGEFPSLAPRPVEQLSMEEPIRVDPPVAPDPAFRGRVAALLGQARQGDEAFEAAYARALPLVRGAGPSGSDSWVQAQEAISRVEAARLVTSGALAELDRLAGERADEPTSGEDHQAMLGAVRSAQTLVAEQQRRIAALQNSVSRP